MRNIALVISCEHASNALPAEYTYLFDANPSILNSHRGLDIGAAAITKFLGKKLDTPYFLGQYSRMLLDLNRSTNHPKCFSEYSSILPEKEKRALIEQIYKPHRFKVEQTIQENIDNGKQVLHLAIHSFTPELDGKSRNAAIGLLYDPARHGEQEVARLWRSLLLNEKPAYKVRLNYPYQGKTDGFCTSMRKRYSEKEYLGFEVESNQALLQEEDSLAEVKQALYDSLRQLLQLL